LPFIGGDLARFEIAVEITPDKRSDALYIIATLRKKSASGRWYPKSFHHLRSAA
jgi:hypothetical protein